MTNHDFTLTLSVDATPDQVFDAINDVRAWWSGEITGRADRVGDEFAYRYKEMHRSVQKVTELVRGKRVVWRVTDALLSFVNEKSEWKGTTIVFAIAPKDGKTEVQFTHEGLNPQFECYDTCSSGWSALISGNLRRRITTGKQQPDAFASG